MTPIIRFNLREIDMATTSPNIREMLLLARQDVVSSVVCVLLWISYVASALTLASVFSSCLWMPHLFAGCFGVCCLSMCYTYIWDQRFLFLMQSGCLYQRMENVADVHFFLNGKEQEICHGYDDFDSWALITTRVSVALVG